MDWQKDLQAARAAAGILGTTIENLKTFHNESTAEIAKYLRGGGLDLDIDAIKATLTRPYTVLPINEHEAHLIHWKGVKMPVMGWVLKQEPSFIISKVTRSMDLITPIPLWMKEELGWKPPEHQAVIDGSKTGIQLMDGDEATFKKRYGNFLGNKQGDDTWKIKGGDAWIKLVAALVRDGILPYQPQPVAKEHWDEKAKLSPKLLEILESLEWKKKRPYIERAVEQFKLDGASLFNIPPGAGKSLIIQIILTHFRGKTCLFGDTTGLCEQWRADLPERVPGAKVTVSTYQGAAKHLNTEWDLVVFDEAQRMPANSFSRLAFMKTHYRIGATGTAWREDERQHLIVALCGRPFYIPWEELIALNILKKPKITVATVPSESAKIGYVRQLISKRKGKSLIFCDWIDKGKVLAQALDVPFIYGETSNKLQKIRDNEVSVVSKIADRGISMIDLRLVIEVAGAGKSREQFGQRLGRLLHGQFEGEFYTVFTPEELSKFRGRLFGVEAELAGQVDIQFIEIGSFKEVKQKSESSSVTKTRVIDRQPKDEIGKTLAIPSIAAKIRVAKTLCKNARAHGWMERILRNCWSNSYSPKEMTEGLGNTSRITLQRIQAACVALQKAGLLKVVSVNTYAVDHKEIDRLKNLKLS